MSLNSIMSIAASGMSSQTIRLNVSASNMANADSISNDAASTYKAKMAVFESDEKGVHVSKIIENDAPPRSEYKPGHPLADQSGYIHLPNINRLEEMTNVISASRDYQRDVKVMLATKNLMLETLKLGD